MKHCLKALLFISALCGVLVTVPAYSFEIGIGATTWYGKWLPAWGDGKYRFPMIPSGNPSIPLPIPLKINEFRSDMSFLYGPMLMIGFNQRWSLASVFMYGRFEFMSSGPCNSGAGILAATRYIKKIEKYDSDSTFNCQVNRYFRLFLGFKYQGYTYREDMWFVNVGVADTGEAIAKYARDTMRNLGPGLGFGINIPLVENFFMLVSASASYLFGQEQYLFKGDCMYLTGNTNASAEVAKYRKTYFYSVAGNSSLSLAYYISKADISLSLGFRYQVLYFIQPWRGWRSYFENAHYNARYDHFYGAVASVVYSFKFNKDQPDAVQ